MKNNVLPILLFLFLMGFKYCIAQNTIYVDQAATGFNNGSSWADAYTDFQTALDVAVSGDIINVRVGTYYPSKDITGNSTPADFSVCYFLL